jgi:hypothetical protein
MAMGSLSGSPIETEGRKGGSREEEGGGGFDMLPPGEGRGGRQLYHMVVRGGGLANRGGRRGAGDGRDGGEAGPGGQRPGCERERESQGSGGAPTCGLGRHSVRREPIQTLNGSNLISNSFQLCLI